MNENNTQKTKNQKLPETELKRTSIPNAYLTIILVGLAQGSQELTSLSYLYIYLYDIKANPSTLHIIESISYIPWCFKPQCGILTDYFKLFGYRRKGYQIVFTYLEIISHIIMFTKITHVYLVILLQLLQTVCIVFRNVIAEGLLVILTRENSDLEANESDKQISAQSHVAIFFMAKAFGSMFINIYSTKLLEVYGTHGVFIFATIIPFLILVNTICFYEESGDCLDNFSADRILRGGKKKKRKKKRYWKKLKRVLKICVDSELKYFLLLTFQCCSCPSLTSLFNSYYTFHLKFDLQSLSAQSTYTSIGYFFSIFFLIIVLNEISFRKIYITSAFLVIILNLLSLLQTLDPEKFGLDLNRQIFTNGFLLMFINELNFLPLMALCVRLCPKFLEATTYSLFTGIFNFGFYLSNLLSSLLIIIFEVENNNYSGMYKIIIIQVCYGLLVTIPLLFIEFPRSNFVENEEIKIRNAQALVATNLDCSENQSLIQLSDD